MYNKISIIGGPGTGKTTLSNILSKKYNLPVTHIDGIHHLKNWEIRDKSERDQIILDIVNKDKWIIDGTYHGTLKIRLEKSDFIIWLNYSTFAQLRGVFKRYFKIHGKERDEIPGCKERLNLEFLKYILNYNKKKRHFIYNSLQNINTNKFIVFHKQKDLNLWLKSQNIDIKKKLE